MEKTTTVGEQIEIFMRYVSELETLDIPIMAAFEEEEPGLREPGLSTAKAAYTITRKRALEPLDLMIRRCEPDTVEKIKKTKEQFLEKYPEV